MIAMDKCAFNFLNRSKFRTNQLDANTEDWWRGCSDLEAARVWLRLVLQHARHSFCLCWPREIRHPVCLLRDHRVPNTYTFYTLLNPVCLYLFLKKNSHYKFILSEYLWPKQKQHRIFSDRATDCCSSSILKKCPFVFNLTMNSCWASIY